VNLGSGWGSDITLTQDQSRLTLQYEFFGRGDMQPPIIYHFMLDGSASTNRLLLGFGVEERVSRTRWDGQRLVITTTVPTPNPGDGVPPSTEITQVLSLENPATLIVETTRPAVSGATATTTRTTYTRT
jgi:hypothetical protein